MTSLGELGKAEFNEKNHRIFPDKSPKGHDFVPNFVENAKHITALKMESCRTKSDQTISKSGKPNRDQL